VRFLQGEEARAPYEAAGLPQPLPQSIAAKQKRLDQAVAAYRQCVDLGVPEWTHASAFRIGQALVGFGEALERSERPADLQGDALLAYEEVLRSHSQTFYDRGEAVWADLLRQKPSEDEWIQLTQTSLWRRLGGRFFYRPEVEFPLAAATPPGRIRREKRGADEADTASGAPTSPRDLAERKGTEP
jgi:hypothetical protein